MRRLSSRFMLYYRRLYPVLWFGMALLVFGIPFIHNGHFFFFPGLFMGIPADFLGWPAAAVISAVVLVVYFITKKTQLNMVDEVLDAGDALLIRKGDQEERIALSDIANVSFTWLNGHRVTLTLKRPSIFGTRIRFFTPQRLFAASASLIADELIGRIGAKRKTRDWPRRPRPP